MPITPRFALSQTDTHLIVKINTPHVRVSASSIDASIDGPEFLFYASPYLLRLNFPGNLLDDFESNKEAKATFDPSLNHGTITMEIWKEEAGHWKDLDMIGRLISSNYNNTIPILSSKQKSLITVVSSTTKDEDSTHRPDDTSDTDDDSDTGQIRSDMQSLENMIGDEDLLCITKPRYGFLDMFHSVFTAFAREGLLQEMMEIPNPDDNHVDETRREQRLLTENEKFDPDRYVGDLFLDDEDSDMVYSEAIRMTPHYWMDHSHIEDELNFGFQKLSTNDSTLAPPQHETIRESSSLPFGDSHSYFDRDELALLSMIRTSIPRQEQINANQTRSLLLSLLDILYAYAYDHRTTMGEPTCESSWTVAFLSPTLSWLEKYVPPYDSSKDVVQWCIRRALIYPYIRNFDFCSQVVLQDVIRILNQGRRTVVRCLLQLHTIFETSEVHYLHNKLYIDPFISWVQSLNEEDLFHTLAQEIHTVCITKHSLDLNLDEIETSTQSDDASEADSDSSDSSEEHSSGISTSEDEVGYVNTIDKH